MENSSSQVGFGLDAFIYANRLSIHFVLNVKLLENLLPKQSEKTREVTISSFFGFVLVL